MAKKGFIESIGAWAFMIGLLLAIVIALVFATKTPAWAIFVLAVLGLIVGLLNITDKEVQKFLVAAIAFMLSFQSLAYVSQAITFGWEAVGAFFRLMGIFIAPAAAVVAIKALFQMSKN